jgi:GT2 family glycosyltransferase
MTPDVSICIVNWNGGEMLRNLLASLQASDPSITLQTIVVDNASSDDSMQDIEQRFPGVITVRNPDNRGFATGNIQAAERAAGRYLLFLNNDTIAHPGTITRLVKFLDENPACSAVGPKLVEADGQPQRTARNLPSFRALVRQRVKAFPRWTGLFGRQYRAYRSAYDPEISAQVPQLAAAALLVRHDVYKKIGGWDAGYPFGVEDVDFCLRLQQYGPIQYLPDIAITHLGRISSRANYGFTNYGYEIGYARYLRKHHRRRGAHRLYKLLIILDAPFRVVYYGCQYGLSTLLRRRESADRAHRRLNAAWSFLFQHLGAFWNA